MKAKNEIKQWLSKGKPYEEGLMLLDKYSKNRNLQRMLRRIKKPGKLEYELRKISKISKEKAVKLKAEKPDKLKNKGKNNSAESNFLQILHKKSINYEKLPAELQKVYNQIKLLYKERADYHSKAKLLTLHGADEETIGNLVVKIKETDAQIRSSWDKIDNYNPEDYKKEKSKPKEPITNKRISANRKYISSNKKKLKDDPEKWIPKIQERVDELIQAGENFKPLIVEELKGYGIKL